MLTFLHLQVLASIIFYNGLLLPQGLQYTQAVMVLWRCGIWHGRARQPLQPGRDVKVDSFAPGGTSPEGSLILELAYPDLSNETKATSPLQGEVWCSLGEIWGRGWWVFGGSIHLPSIINASPLLDIVRKINENSN